MSNNVNDSNFQGRLNSTYAVSSHALDYGRTVTLDRGNIPQVSQKESFIDKLKFFYGEYFGGILFVSALLLYTLLVPVGVKNPIKAIFFMLDNMLKKVLDIGGAIIGLILALPIFIVIPILIKLTSRGPVFYTQERIGIDRRRNSRRISKVDMGGNQRLRERRREDYFGQPFKVIKFRTMVNNAEKSSGPVWATANDNRVTQLGHIMRKTRIDEIPQLLNVLVGDMSMVGPRPERLHFIKDLSAKIPKYRVRLKVKPGITGEAQVNTGYDSSIQSVIEKVEHDLKYIRSWSIWSDVKILMKTVVVVITGKGAC
jgi:lipopolysaccharide/colanic/teichoic acid biosynthesis glycosyltransferase